MTRDERDVKQQERYDVLRQMLEDRRREIKEKIHSLIETLPDQQTLVRDPEEQSVTDFVQEVDFALMEMKSDTLQKIDEAVRRLEEGTYGRCIECEGDIPQARLTALPFAERCRDCQEKQEAAADQLEPRHNVTGLGTRLRDALALSPDQEAKHE
jgi:DnaK suppressor protein